MTATADSTVADSIITAESTEPRNEAPLEEQADVGATPTIDLLGALFAVQWKRLTGFLFPQISGATVAAFRTVLGLINLVWLATLLPDLEWFYGFRAVNPPLPFERGRWNVFLLVDSEVWVGPAVALGILAALGLITGRAVRLSALVLAVLTTSLIRENSLIWNAGDGLLRIVTVLFALGCLVTPKAALTTRLFGTLDETGRRVWPQVPGFALRLAQLQLTAIYLSAVVEKLPGERWQDGTAAAMALKLETMERFWTPDFLTESLLVANALTWSTLFLELALPFWLWTKRTRMFAIIAGVSMHAAFDYGLHIGVFSYAIFACYIAFLPDEWSEGALRWIADRLPGLPELPKVTSLRTQASG